MYVCTCMYVHVCMYVCVCSNMSSMCSSCNQEYYNDAIVHVVPMIIFVERKLYVYTQCCLSLFLILIFYLLQAALHCWYLPDGLWFHYRIGNQILLCRLSVSVPGTKEDLPVCLPYPRPPPWYVMC